MPLIPRPPKAVAGVLLALLCLALTGLASRTRFFRTLELKTVDARFRLLGDQGLAGRSMMTREMPAC